MVKTLASSFLEECQEQYFGYENGTEGFCLLFVLSLFSHTTHPPSSPPFTPASLGELRVPPWNVTEFRLNRSRSLPFLPWPARTDCPLGRTFNSCVAFRVRKHVPPPQSPSPPLLLFRGGTRTGPPPLTPPFFPSSFDPGSPFVSNPDFSSRAHFQFRPTQVFLLSGGKPSTTTSLFLPFPLRVTPHLFLSPSSLRFTRPQFAADFPL